MKLNPNTASMSNTLSTSKTLSTNNKNRKGQVKGDSSTSHGTMRPVSKFSYCNLQYFDCSKNNDHRINKMSNGNYNCYNHMNVSNSNINNSINENQHCQTHHYFNCTQLHSSHSHLLTDTDATCTSSEPLQSQPHSKLCHHHRPQHHYMSSYCHRRYYHRYHVPLLSTQAIFRFYTILSISIYISILPMATSFTNLLDRTPIIHKKTSPSLSISAHAPIHTSMHVSKSIISISAQRKFRYIKHKSNKHTTYATNTATTTNLQMSPKYIELFTNPDPTYDDTKTTTSTTTTTTTADDENSTRWLAWMTGGNRVRIDTTPRQTADVKMRDPEELGGLPRAERYASRDWLHNTINMPSSVILKSVRFPVIFMSCWGLLISIIHFKLKLMGKANIASRFCIPTAPHSLMVSALGLLLVFRTNSAYQRFSEGRKIWEEILSVARDLSRLIKLYEGEIGTAKLRRLNRLLAAFPYLLRFRIRPNSIMKRINDPEVKRDPEFSLILYQDHAISDSDAEAAAVASDEETTGMSRRKPRELYWVDKRTLPWRLLPDMAMEECARAQNRPLWICDRMAKELHSVPDSLRFTARERLALLSKVDKLSGTIGACERIHQTVVPLNYARHALRCLTMWLLSLPFALVRDMGLMTGPTLFLISWMLFGVYEIGYSIEDPFQGTLRLSILCDAIRRDVLGDEIIRNTAFTLEDKDIQIDTKGDSETTFYEEDDDDDDNLESEDENVSIEIEEIIIDEIGNVVNATEIEILNGNTGNDDFLVTHPIANGSVDYKVGELEKQASISS